jgi:hypothetical protein
LIVELAETGERKGNFQRRLEESVDIMVRYEKISSAQQLSSAEKQREFIKLKEENAKKGNTRNPGMV